MKRDPLIDQFADSLWLSDGLSRNTIESYGRDIAQLSQWLEKEQTGSLLSVDPQHLQAFLGHRIDTLHASPRSTARLTSGIKRFFQYLVREKLITADPSAHLESPKLSRGLPQSLSEADVDALLAAPDQQTPLGLRDCAMLET
ncbi:MAG: site-specific integrase, partial [Burkholderiales bacterium]|nr:site-specific integrase [Burkholderiales bacterium]